jgi:uncharacterized cupredoxin-like copper-binding protein
MNHGERADGRKEMEMEGRKMMILGVRRAIGRVCLLLLVPVLALANLAALPVVRAATADVTIIGRDYAFDMPSTIPAGLVHLTFLNQGKEEHEAQLFQLKPGVTEAQLLKTLQDQGPQSGPPPGPPPATTAGGANSIGPGQRQEVYLTLQPGTYEVVCFDSGADNVPHIAKGMYKSFTVTGTAAAATPPAADGTVTLKDYAFGLPDVITQAKPLTLQVVNNGPSEHEMALFKLLPGKTVQDAVAFVQSENPTGPPPGDAAGGLAAIEPGASGWVVLNLAPGTYFVACFVPDNSGKPHVADGMYTSFTVAAPATAPVPSAPLQTGTGGAAHFVRRLGEG